MALQLVEMVRQRLAELTDLPVNIHHDMEDPHIVVVCVDSKRTMLSLRTFHEYGLHELDSVERMAAGCRSPIAEGIAMLANIQHARETGREPLPHRRSWRISDRGDDMLRMMIPGKGRGAFSVEDE